MNKAYIIWPLAGLLVFGAFYWNFNKGYTEKQRQEEVRKEEERKARLLHDAEARKKAIEDAIAAQQKRLAERKAKEKKEEEEKQAFNDLNDRRLRAFDEVNRRLRPQLERLKGDVDDLQQQIAKLAQQKKQYADEETFLHTYVSKAEGNVKTYTDLLDQLATAEKARAEAEAAAKAAAKKS